MKIFKQVFHDITNINKKNIKLTIHKSSHRKKLVRWLYEVTKDFRYSQITFAISLQILDTYTQTCGFDISSYQLIGVTSLFIAAKFEERKLKSIKDYVQVTDNFVTVNEILKMEKIIIFTINWNFNIPHSYLEMWYLKRMSNKFSLIERREIIFAIFANLLENTSSTNNMYCIYLEGIREAERILSCLKIPVDLQFYIKNNRVTNCIKF